GQLVPEVAVEGLEPGRHGDGGFPVSVGGDVAVVDVHHVGALHEGVVQVLVRRVQRIVYLEGAASLREVAGHVQAAGNHHVAVEYTCGAGAGAGAIDARARDGGPVHTIAGVTGAVHAFRGRAVSRVSRDRDAVQGIGTC